MNLLRVWAASSALVLLAAIPAGAQAVRVPPGSMPAAPNGSPSDGITVVGYANLDVPATKATTTVHLSSSKPFTVDDIKPLLDEVAKADGSNDSVTLPPFVMLGAGPMHQFTGTGVVDHPTAAMLAGAIPIVAAAFAKVPQFTLDNAMVTLSLADCGTYIDRARAAAIADARKRAESIAHDLGVAVGAVKAVAATDQMQNRAGECTAQYYVPGGYGGPNEPMGLTDYVTVHIAERVTIRYAIR